MAETVYCSRLAFLLAAAAIAHWQVQEKAVLQEESSEVLGKRFHFSGRAVACSRIPGRKPFNSLTRFGNWQARN